MVDFRKAILLLAVLVMATGMASAQVNPLSCTANTGVTPTIRHEGAAEEVGQVVIICTGGTSVPAGTPIPTINVQIFTQTAITSRILASGQTESLLFIDEPAPTAQVVGVTPNTVVVPALGGGVYGGGTTGRPNVFTAATVAGNPNSLLWSGIPFDPPGTTNPANQRVLRLANVRVNASGASFVLNGFNPYYMFISISGTGSLPLSNPQPIVASVQQGLQTTGATVSLNQCLPPSSSGYGITFKELFPTAFRDNMTADVTNQNILGTVYNTESMYSNQTAFASTAANGAGVATQGTQLRLAFANVPSNVSLAVTTCFAPATSGCAVSVDTGNIVASGVSGNTADPGTGAVTLSGGAGVVVWEVTKGNPATLASVPVRVYVTYASGTLPSLGTFSAHGSYAPLTTESPIAASSSRPVPRFVDSTDADSAFAVNPCKTNLLFPFVTSQSGFDTGIAIANTSIDPFVNASGAKTTAPQSGPCTIYYYASAISGTKPASQTSTSVAAGDQVVFALSAGGDHGIVATPNFQGYIIASCNFQFAHGFAFISDLGSNKLAEGYLALVLDQGLYDSSSALTRSGAISEVLKH